MKTLCTKIASILALMGVLAVASLNSGCQATPTKTNHVVDDAVITTKVKNALLADDDIKSFEIKVETLKGIVQLSGFVDNSDQKLTAMLDAGSIKGVHDVANNLIVRKSAKRVGQL